MDEIRVPEIVPADTEQLSSLQELLAPPVVWDPVSLTVPQPREEREVTSHHASALTGCVREAYYRWTKAEITNPADKLSRMKMEAGEDAAQWFGKNIVALAPGWGYHVEILDAERVIELHHPGLVYPIRGRLDYRIAIEGPQGRQVLAIEYKSLFGFGSERIIGGTGRDGKWQAGDPTDRPSYLTQLWAYMRSGIEADGWVLVCQDRGNKLDQSYELRWHKPDDSLYWAYVPKGFPGQYSSRRTGSWHRVPFTWDKVVERLRMIEQAVEARVPPDRIDPVTGERFMAEVKDGKLVKPKAKDQRPGETWWKCNGYCEYANLCWGAVTTGGDHA